MELGSDFLFQLRLRFETGDIAQQEDLQNCPNGLYGIGKLALVTPRIGHEVGHLATWFLPGEVWVQKFKIAHMCS